MQLLIVSPHFPPTNAADMHRARTVLPYLRENGWTSEVLAVEPHNVTSPRDPWLVAGLPDNVPVHRVTGLGLGWSRIPGLGTLTYRAYNALRMAGGELLSSGRFDLVYFSTTQFGIHALGPYWRRKYRVPFVMDYQDPWVSDYYREHRTVTPPGGRLKYGIIQWIARRQEPRVLEKCSGITSVSCAYPAQLATRYPQIMSHMPVLVAPFPGEPTDISRAVISHSDAELFTRHVNNDKLRWVYVGRGGTDMHRSIAGFFISLHRFLKSNPTYETRLRVDFIGTSYAAVGRGPSNVASLARKYGLEAVVAESPDRIPYSESLRCIIKADALIVPGSDDPGYTASKIYPYLLAKKPLLAIFREESSVVELIKRVGGGVVIPFSADQPSEHIAESIEREWFIPRRYLSPTPLNDSAFAPFTAQYQAKQLARFFCECIHRAETPTTDK